MEKGQTAKVAPRSDGVWMRRSWLSAETIPKVNGCRVAAGASWQWFRAS